MKMVSLLKGVGSCVPGYFRLFPELSATSNNSARYCYGVWLKHLVHLHHAGMTEMPKVMVELGPGNSLGVGLCALLCGASVYYGLDVVPFSQGADHEAMLMELVEMFRRRAPRPERGWPQYDHLLPPDLFPHDVLPDSLLDHTLSPERVEYIRRSLTTGGTDSGIGIHYVAPWKSPSQIPLRSADLVLSHAVLQHTLDLESIYRANNLWLKKGGWSSHHLDLTSMSLHREWNGQYAVPYWKWLIARGRRPFFPNCVPLSGYLKLCEEYGFEATGVHRKVQVNKLARRELAARYKDLSEEDLTTASAMIEFVKVRELASVELPGVEKAPGIGETGRR